MEPRVRRAREDELAEVGRLTVDAYAADGRITPDHPYATHLVDAEVRQRDASSSSPRTVTAPCSGR